MKEHEEITITLVLKTTPGKVRMKMSDCMGKVRGDTGAEVGHTAGTIGAGYEVKIGDKAFYVGPKDIWNAVCDATGHEDWKFEAEVEI